jgi:protocatechuate 3,4-dioxygenase beta subunit
MGRRRMSTVYPGWYPGRTVHIHVIVRTSGRVFTSQLYYFPESVTDAVFGRAPYDERPGRDTTNATDEIPRSSANPPSWISPRLRMDTSPLPGCASRSTPHPTTERGPVPEDHGNLVR